MRQFIFSIFINVFNVSTMCCAWRSEHKEGNQEGSVVGMLITAPFTNDLYCNGGASLTSQCLGIPATKTQNYARTRFVMQAWFKSCTLIHSFRANLWKGQGDRARVLHFSSSVHQLKLQKYTLTTYSAGGCGACRQRVIKKLYIIPAVHSIQWPPSLLDLLRWLWVLKFIRSCHWTVSNLSEYI